MKSKVLLKSLVLFMAMGTLFACKNAKSNTNEGGNNQQQQTDEGGGSGEKEQTPPKDTTDYGKVFFKTIYVYADAYGNNFDGVLIRPTFTIPEAAKNEVFEYEIANEDICYIENDRVYSLGFNGSTKVTAKSQHLKGSFLVYSSDHYNNAQAFGTAKSLANKAKNATNQGTTLFVGDSFFEFWRNKTGIDENFATAFSGYDVANVGISGTQAREWRSLVGKLIDPYEPKNLVLNIGINDVDDNSEDGESTAEYIMNLCKDIWVSNPNCNIYYCSITRCAGYFASKLQFHSASNEFMKTNCQNNEKLHYLDIMAVWGNDYASYEQSDGLHPNTAGYEVIKTLVKENVPLELVA